MIDTVVFDLGAVLIAWDPRNLYRKLTGDEGKIEFFLSQICNSEWNSHLDAGRPFVEAVQQLSEKFPEHAEWIEIYHSRWEEMISGPIDGTVKILNELKESQADDQAIKLYALTNWSSETFPYALNRFAFLKHFDGIVVSGDERLIKPDPDFFRILLDRYSLVPKQCVFIDDVARNVSAASKLGLHALLFRDAAELRRQLQQMGLLKNS